MGFGGSGGGYSGGSAGAGSGGFGVKKKNPDPFGGGGSGYGPQGGSGDGPFGAGKFGGGSPVPGPNDLPDPAGVVPMAEGIGGKFKKLTDSWAGQSGYSPDMPQYDPTSPNFERGQQNQVRGQQDEYNAWLKNAAMGKGPSVAQEQLSQGRDAAISAAASQAASARGGNAALANRSAVQSGANLNMQAARDAAALRAQEQMGYANQWGQGLQAQRSGDLMGRGQSIDEQKAQLAAQTAYQQNQAQIAAGNAERGQGIAGEVLGGSGGGITDMVPGMGGGGFKLPSDERAKIITNPGQPAITTGGPMQPAPQPRAYSDQFAGIAQAQDAGTLGKTAQQEADEAETRRSNIQGLGAGVQNAKSDHGVGLVSSIIGMVSDERAKTPSFAGQARDIHSAAESALREHAVDQRPVGLLSPYSRARQGAVARRAAERVAAWLQPATMRTGVAEAARGGVENASGGAALGRMSPEEHETVRIASRGEGGAPGSVADQRDYARRAAIWTENARTAEADRSRYEQAGRDDQHAEATRAAVQSHLQARRERAMVSDTGAKMFTDSDERAKVPSLGGTESGDDFNRAANARMGEDQGKLIEEALLRAGLARVEREATVDGGLRAGKTNVARFNDVEPLVRQMAEIPDTSWRYKPEFAEKTNQKMGLPPGDPFGHAEKVSATTQDYERIPATAGAVIHDPAGKTDKLDGGQLASTAATGVGAVARHALSLEQRMDRLEGKGNPNPARDSGAGVTPDEWEAVRRGLGAYDAGTERLRRGLRGR